MKKWLLLLIPAAFVLLGWLLYRERNAPPKVPFAPVTRETVASTLVTNGTVEPYEWEAVLAERSGVVESFHAARGTAVKRGDLLVELGAREAKTELAAAQTRVTEARAELQVFDRGGRSAELADLEGEMARARMDLDVARKDHAVLERLAAKQAATRQEVDEAARRVESAELRLQDLARRRAALVDPSDRTVATAKLHDAEAAVDLARLRLDKSLIRAPITGMVYDTDVRTGSYVNLGDTLAKVGRTGKVRLQVYVDEPELGRVAVGMPVTITWDALQGRRWQGAVERMPTEIMSLGTRHVGEVPCVIENPGGELIPGTNINAEIRSHVAPDALSIPREALRREDGVTGVFLLQRDRIVWRKVTPGISSITRTQIVEGLSEGDAVALPSDTHLVSGALIRPEFR